ncbi:Nin one binding Zn-ribbon like-domain-containing protein [Aspergillus pseudonomiae]|uniref:20S-pre-rRNA D-site endonuclease NOB1 n=1 Tax=Aspergillus nomiae NRRL (strain ATCC 15546 / NRRL 13137 / CBS 260.88 / M93) TaxID=1509407 RepID=A0A0L1JAE8_ASPN3|nr:20S-pre-rRNA D-site endonuclease nob1 [Aspergillus nomiae NRRL 13137]KAB8265509.1 Nin one binding Zn-ribbon like-domain-containing protein [Aspergillus pseudonomiae]KNG88724.1 20S-pre-rRNA D-site endonuclease nob1 [Aspergillus nomiae NRRL 13137]
MADTTSPPKSVHTIVLDAGPILKNTPPLSTLLAQCEELLITPSVVSEIRDPDARLRVETMYLPFLKQRTPTPKSISVLSEFAKKTGDRAVLSRTDIEVLALAYEIECERNGGDWRLRSVPGQKQVNGKPPVKEEVKQPETADESGQTEEKTESPEVDAIAEDLENTALEKPNEKSQDEATAAEETKPAEQSTPQEPQEEDDEAADSDGGEWITPSNLKKKQARDEGISASATPEPKVMQVATMTTDFACQNVLLQMNLNLLSTTTLQRIRHLKSFIKRCHACFFTTKDMNKQFCPRCGKDTLTRVSCTTDANGQFKMHLKKNMQWNNRGNVFSIPKPTHGSSSGKWKGGGGKGGWGTDLILAEDQKEYVRATAEESRRLRKERDLMDEDYLPGILTGERNKHGGRIKVGAGKSVNSRKR